MIIQRRPVGRLDDSSDSKGREVMTLRLLDEARDQILKALGLGPKSYRRSSAYVDYVSLEYAVFTDMHNAPGEHPAKVIENVYRPLCEQVGWNWSACRILQVRGNSVTVTLQRADVISSGDARMPVG